MKGSLAMKKIVLLSFISLLAAHLSAGDYNWTGAGGDSAWTNRDNWAEGAVPAKGNGNRAVFEVEGSLNVKGLSPELPSSFIVKSGDVVLEGYSPRYSSNGEKDSTPMVFDVAEGSSLLFSNRLERGKSAMNVTKTGSGVLKLMGACGVDSGFPPLGVVDVKEGEIEFSTSNDNWLFYCTNLVVRKDAVFNCRKNNGIRHKKAVEYPCLVEVEEGGLLKLVGGSTAMTVSALAGNGTVQFSGTSSTLVKLTPHSRLTSCVFGGNFLPTGKAKVELNAESTGVQIIGSKNSFGDIYHLIADGNNLAFAPDAGGEFSLSRLQIRPGTRLKLEDTLGNPVKVIVSGTDAVQTCGSGSISFSSERTVLGDALQHSGALSMSKAVTFGDGTAADNDADLSTISSISQTGGDASAIFNNAGDCELTVRNITLPSLKFLTPNKVDFNGGLFSAAHAANSYDTTTTLRTPDGMELIDANGTATVRQRSGNVYVKKTIPGRYELLGGKLSIASSVKPYSELITAHMFLNGGTLAFNKRGAQYEFTPFNTEDGYLFDVTVGEKGVVLEDEEVFNSTGSIALGVPFKTGAGEGRTDGGVVQKTRLAIRLSIPMSITGPYRLQDGHLGISSGCDLESTPAALGSGDTVVGNAMLYFDHMNYKTRTSKSRTLALASGAGAKLVAAGSALLYFTPNSSDAAQHMTAGSLGRERGGVLFLADSNSSSFDGTANSSSLKFTETIPANRACGISSVPVIVADAGINADNYRSSGSRLTFASLADDGYVKRFKNVKSDFSGGAASVVSIVDRTTVKASDDLKAGALHISHSEFKLSAGGRIGIGDGVNPGMLLFETPSLSGTGTIDFGGAEGVIAVNSLGKGSNLTVPFAIEGRDGISFVATPWTAYHRMYLGGKANWDGDTVINSTWVDPMDNQTLGDKVVIGAGKRCGGVLAFSKDVVFETDIEASGWGIQLGTYDVIHSAGAIVFEADAEVAGALKLVDEVRVLSSGADVRGTISGVVSGDRLSVYRGKGTLVLSGENTYSGGTLVRDSTLALCRAASAGTGGITLDNATLAFENSAPLVFANDVSGVGTVALKGTAPVLFRCDKSSLTAALDLCGTKQTFSEMPPFGIITNSLPQKATIALADGLGKVDWPDVELGGRISLAVGEGTILDLGGRTIEVFRLEIDTASRIVNGTVKEERPIGGMSIIVK